MYFASIAVLKRMEFIHHNNKYKRMFRSTLFTAYIMYYSSNKYIDQSLHLEMSPLSNEVRYQLWKLDPNHSVLSPYQTQINEWKTHDMCWTYSNNNKSKVKIRL
eukprot:UN10721